MEWQNRIMSTAPPLESLDIKVVYSATARPKGKGRRALSAPGGRREILLVIVGLMNLAAAGALCWATWWPADQFIFETLVWKTPIPGVNLNDVAGIFGVVPEPTTGTDPIAPPTEPAETPRFTGDTARAVIGGSAYSWLTLAAAAACCLALAGGAAMAAAGGTPWRLAGWILTTAAVLGLAWGAYHTWAKFGMEFPTEATRAGMAGLVALFLFAGLAVGRRPRLLSRIAAVTLVLSAVASVAGLLLGSQCNAIEPEHAALGFLATVFVVHSAYGWVLWPLAKRLRT